VQPDIIFVAATRAHIIRNQVWGAPDLVVEVASIGTARRDRTVKLAWYRRYGVRECWLVDPRLKRVEVINPTAGPAIRSRIFTGTKRLRSSVLRKLDLSASQVFE
jgi:Uma2 family endonuclease